MIDSEPAPLPQRTANYFGRLTDTSRWDSFSHRLDDVFICTPPKCGTTWTQAICANLILGTSDFSGKLTDISPWFDSKIEQLPVCLDNLAAQQHRRFIKTHTPLDGIPYHQSSVYFVVYREPRDAYFSVRNHLLNMSEPPDLPQLSSDPAAGFRAWVDADYEPEQGEQRSLIALTHHFSSYWAFRHLPNLHFFHFSDMKRDLPYVVARMADILNIEVTAARIDEVCHAVSFGEMKKNASAFAPASGKSLFKSDENFFNSGSNNQWHGVLSDADIACYEQRLHALLEPDEAAWLAREEGEAGQ